MHELSIAQAIVDVATRHAGESTVSVVHVRVGQLRQVVPSALEFSFELCAHGTRVDGAALVLEVIPAGVRCRGCAAESEPSGFPLTCASCGGLDVEVVQGEELQVESLELEEPHPEGELITSGG